MEHLFKALGDENRLRMINLLQGEELCVCEIEAILDTSQSNVSRHLTKLRSEDIVIFKKKAQWTYYQIDPVFIRDNENLYHYLIEKMQQKETFQDDLEQLSLYKEGKIHCGLMAN
ncbi:transcriptional regulator, ArsR family [Alkalibacterium gilvum]|uniref:Transcriptional regulator, ArsR family n=1 Tax=Alkalibacterium gilvum TaxID=1130080 RepID=A0A1H6S2X3_9LACT|nr:metalloregulator ArsR/SmtB family transcription factor [Alkalibacterium gilvum]SEI62498.1 transcriptional regulator, ArsR family [Alkalibacterium gilvum]